MQVVLRKDVKNVGRRGDVVSAADGYARNFLIPRGFADFANRGVMRQAETVRKSREIQDAMALDNARGLAAKIGGKTITVTARAKKDGKLFGSVNANDVVEAIFAQQGAKIDKMMVSIDHVKTTGSFVVPVKLHDDIETAVTVEIVAL